MEEQKCQTIPQLSDVGPWPDCAEARNLLGLLHLLYPDTSEQKSQRERERERNGEKILVSLYWPFSHPSFFLHCLFARIPALCLCFLSPSLTLLLISSHPARGGWEVDEGRNREVRWSGWERDEKEQQLTQLKQTNDLSSAVGVLNLTSALCGLCKPTPLTSRLFSWAVWVWRYSSWSSAHLKTVLANNLSSLSYLSMSVNTWSQDEANVLTDLWNTKV